MAYELTNRAERLLDAAALNLFFSAFVAVSEDLRAQRSEKRRLSCAETLRVRGRDNDAARFVREADADLAIAERRLGFGPSVWERLERVPTEYDARQMRALYRTFIRMVAADLTWFASAAAWFFGADVTPARVGPQVAAGVDAIASATRRTPAGVLRLIEGGKLPVVFGRRQADLDARLCCGLIVVTALAPSRLRGPFICAWAGSPAWPPSSCSPKLKRGFR